MLRLANLFPQNNIAAIVGILLDDAYLAWAAGSDKEESKEKSAVGGPSASASVADELAKLVQLHKEGFINADEFEHQKKAVLKR